MKFSLYFMGCLPEGETNPTPETPDATKYLWNFKGTLLEFTHNWGSENQEGPVYHNGNTEPRGFGHIAFLCDDIYKNCEDLEKAGVKFQKRLDDGRMKGLAFALDPDGYWIEIIKRPEEEYLRNPLLKGVKYNLAQTMIRIKDPKVSVPFYKDRFGMKLFRETFS